MDAATETGDTNDSVAADSIPLKKRRDGYNEEEEEEEEWEKEENSAEEDSESEPEREEKEDWRC